MTVWLLLAGLVVAALLVGEGACRWWVRRRTRYQVWPTGMRLEIQMAPEVFPELEPRVRFDINADGERGGEVPRNTSGLYRVLVAGGSSVECFALDQPTSWPGALERLLNSPDSLHSLGARQVHVGNIGHSGVGSADLDRILERVLPQYRHLDAILVMVGASDVYHWLEDGASPSRPPSHIPETGLFASHPRQPFGWKPGQWASTELGRRLRRSLHRVEVKERAGAWFAAARRMRAEAKEVRTTVADPTTVLEYFEHHFDRALRRAMAHADRVVLVRQPWFEDPYTAEEAAHFWHGGVGQAWKETVSAYYSHEVINGLLGLVDARAVKVAEAAGVAWVNLRPLLTGRLQHYYDHDHYTPAGAAVVARRVAAALLDRDGVALSCNEPSVPYSGSEAGVIAGRVLP